MKCENCGTKNEPKSKFCRECGFDLVSPNDGQPSNNVSELLGKEVEILFFMEHYTGRISGIVNPTEDQVSRYQDGILQKVTINSGNDNEAEETIGAILTFIRQSKEYLGEKFNESLYRNFTTADLKKEYLHLFEKILKAKARQDAKSPSPTQSENIK